LGIIIFFQPLWQHYFLWWFCFLSFGRAQKKGYVAFRKPHSPIAFLIFFSARPGACCDPHQPKRQGRLFIGGLPWFKVFSTGQASKHKKVIIKGLPVIAHFGLSLLSRQWYVRVPGQRAAMVRPVFRVSNLDT